MNRCFKLLIEQHSYKVIFTIATDKDLKNVVISGDTFTSAEVDYTVKLDMDPLLPNTVYYYAFSACGGSAKSSVGRTKTLPAAGLDATKFTIATVSCAFYR